MKANTYPIMMPNFRFLLKITFLSITFRRAIFYHSEFFIFLIIIFKGPKELPLRYQLLILVKRYFGGALVDTVDSHGRNEFNKFANFFQDIQNGNDEYEY